MSKVISGIRKLDNLGRIVIPSEIRKELDIQSDDMMLIQSKGVNITISKFTNVCHCCGDKPTAEVLGVKLCDKCIGEFNKYREMINGIRG